MHCSLQSFWPALLSVNIWLIMVYVLCYFLPCFPWAPLFGGFLFTPISCPYCIMYSCCLFCVVLSGLVSEGFFWICNIQLLWNYNGMYKYGMYKFFFFFWFLLLNSILMVFLTFMYLPLLKIQFCCSLLQEGWFQVLYGLERAFWRRPKVLFRTK